MKKLPYSEGSVFLVPLQGGGYAPGVVARSAPKGKVLLGYFFGPSVASDSDVTVEALRVEDAVLCARFGDLGLVKGLWPIVGSIPHWDRSAWPMSNTVRRGVFGMPNPILVRYADDDPSKVVGEEVLEHDCDLPADGLAGYGFVEAVLSKKLAQEVG